MFSFKRIITLIVAATLVGTTLPAFSANPSAVPTTNRAAIQLDGTTGSTGCNIASGAPCFNPANGPFGANFIVTGTKAIDVRALVYKPKGPTADGRCPADAQHADYVANMSSGVTQYPAGNYTVYWNGMLNSNKQQARGLYCYKISWSNFAAGDKGYRDGFVYLDPTIRGAGSNNNGGNNNGNNGGQNNNGNNNGGNSNNNNNGGNNNGGNTPTYVPPTGVSGTQDHPTTPDLLFAIQPHDIYPESSDPRLNTAVISYRLNSRLPKGLSVTIEDSNGTVLKLLKGTTGPVGPLSTSVTWNGRSSLTGRPYAAGAYSVVFRSTGEITRGTIFVHTGNGSGSSNGNNGNNGGNSNNGADLTARVHPSTIDPTSNNVSVNTAIIDFTVRNRLNGLSLVIYDGGVPVVQLIGTSATVGTGNGSKSWNGRSATTGKALHQGLYQYVFKSGSRELASGYITVKYGNNGNTNPPPPSTSKPVITDFGPQPNTFVAGGSTAFRYSVNQNANAVVSVYKNNTLVKKFTDSVSANDTESDSWTTSTTGTYTYTIEASNSNGRATSKSGVVYVSAAQCTSNCGGGNDNGTQMNVSNVYASPATFNPRNTSSNIYFTLNQRATVTVTVKYGSTTVKQWAGTYGSGAHNTVWNGRYDNDGYVGVGSYSVTVRAASTQNNTTDSGSTSVNVTNGNTPVPTPTPVPVPTTGCGRFTDVPTNHTLCPAIDFVTSRGIFAGYNDGTGRLGINEPIRRAEFLAVVQKAYKFDLDQYSSNFDGTLGYRDLYGMQGEWFMPYVKTFSRLNIMVGYPDSTMRPNQVMTTSELFVSFFQAAERAPYSLLRFRVSRQVDHQPYADTPVNADTYWYVGYAAFARMYNLVPGDFFYPGRGITRGQVIDLIYQTYTKGLIDYGANTVKTTYPTSTMQEYYYPNANVPTTYPYNAPIVNYSNVVTPNVLRPGYVAPTVTPVNYINTNYATDPYSYGYTPTYGTNYTNYDYNGYNSNYGSNVNYGY